MKRLIILAALTAACSGGQKVEPIEALNGPSITGASADPSVTTAENGDVLMSWVGGDSTAYNIYFARSSDEGKTWSAPVKVTQTDNDVKPHGQASPRIVAGGNAIGLFWPNNIPVKGRRFPASQMHFARSTDGGKTWSATTTLNDDTTATSELVGHTFHGATFVPPSTFTVAWLDSRSDHMQEAEHTNMAGGHGGKSEGSSAVYVATSHDLGQTWDTGNRKLWGDACPCCRVALGITPKGQVVAAWRAHLAGDVRDPVIGLIGDSLEPPTRVHEDNWVFPGCPHSGPALSTEGGAARVAWYTGKPGATGVFYAESANGKRFSAPKVVIAGKSLPVAHPSLIAAQAGAIVALDVAPTGERMLTITKIRSSKNDTVVLTGSEGADHPQLVRLKSGALVAWTEKKGNNTRVRVAKIM